uniref:Uncharacterized protein n=1 Tax=Anguilla anguilla TaxID=7936 RepID=A0A0E9TPD6_ANGAN
MSSASKFHCDYYLKYKLKIILKNVSYKNI